MTPREIGHQFTSSAVDDAFSQEDAGLRKSLQSNPTLSENNFIPLVGIAKRLIKEAKGSHLTLNLALSTQPRFIIEMNREAKELPARESVSYGVPRIAFL